MHYSSEFLSHSNGAAVVALKYVESMRYPDGEDATLDKLKDDLNFEITMISGKEYKISVRDNFEHLRSEELADAMNSIYNKWRYIISGKK
jgi:hypothetical protein